MRKPERDWVKKKVQIKKEFKKEKERVAAALHSAVVLLNITVRFVSC